MKWKALLTGVFIAVGIISAIPSVDAQTLRHRRTHQRERIQQGVRSGALTPAEARRLRRNQQRIARRTHKARRSGGELTAAERRRLQRMRYRSGRQIRRQTWDRQRR